MNIKVSSITPLNTYGFLVQFSDGTYAVLGVSIRTQSLDFTKMYPVGWLQQGNVSSYLGAKTTSTNATEIAAVTSALASAGENDTLKLTLAYNATTDEYSFYWNDVLYGTYAASAFKNSENNSITLSGHGAPVNVGVGGFITDKYNGVYKPAVLTSWSFSYASSEEEQA